MKNKGWIIVLIIVITGGAALAFGVNAWKKEKQANCEHQYVLESNISATCEEDGARIYKCNECGKKSKETVDKLGHVPVDLEVEARCDAVGYTDGIVCDVCEKVLSEPTIIPMKEHRFNDGEMLVLATCTELGAKQYVCEDCGATKTEVVEALGHQEEAVSSKDATCTVDGYESGVKCRICQEVISGCAPIYAMGHTFSGVYGEGCTVCREMIYHTNGYNLVTPTKGESAVGNWYRVYTRKYQPSTNEYESTLEFISFSDFSAEVNNGVLVETSPDRMPLDRIFTTAHGRDKVGDYTDLFVRVGEKYEFAVGGELYSWTITEDTVLDDFSSSVYRLEANTCDGMHTAFRLPAVGLCEDGAWSEGAICVKCGEVIIEQQKIEGVWHQYGDGIICTICGDIKLPDTDASVGDKAVGYIYRLYYDEDTYTSIVFADENGENAFVVWFSAGTTIFVDDPDEMLGDNTNRFVVGRGTDERGEYVDIRIEAGDAFSVSCGYDDNGLIERSVTITEQHNVISIKGSVYRYNVTE